MKSKVVLFILLFGFTTIFGFSYRDEKNLSLNSDGIEVLKIDCGAGFLKIKGIDGLESIDVEANIVIRGIDNDDIDSFIEDKITLTLEKRGSKAVLISKIKSFFGFSFFKKKEARIDLNVRIPKTMMLSVEDGSGSITVSDLSANIEVEDGSGSIEIDNIEGNLKIDDGSGSIMVTQVVGDVKIEDNSGEIEVERIGGNLDIDDGSGSIDIYKVGGSVTVDDGSGGIFIDGVEKDVFIKDAGSGSLKIKNVKGRVKK